MKNAEMINHRHKGLLNRSLSGPSPRTNLLCETLPVCKTGNVENVAGVSDVGITEREGECN